MNKDSQNNNGIDCQTFVGLIQLILDDEATKEQKSLFTDHEHLCTHCADKYQIEQSVIQAIRNKIDKDCCPDGFANLVREAVMQNEKETS